MTNAQTPPRGFKKFFGAQDMTQGAPMRNLLMFSIPLLIGNLAQQLYSTADSIIVGHFVGDSALAAVGASGPILNLILVLFMAVSTGAGIVVAQYFGAKDREELSKSIGNAMLLILIAGLVTGAVGLLVSRPMLVLLDTPAENDVLSMASTYLMILFAGMVFSAFYNIGSGILRGLGDSVTPLIFLLIACGLNIILDWVLVSSGWGVMGAAVATIFSQMVSAILCVIRLFRMRDVIDLNRKTLRLSRRRTAQLMKLGLPAGVTQGIFSLAMVMVQALTNSMGQDAMTTSVAVMRVDGFAMLPNFTFGMATSTFVGQNIGAKRMDRVKVGSQKAIILSMAVAGVLVLCLLLFGHHLLRMFTQTERILMLGTRALRILAAGYLAMGVMQVYGGIMRGAGDTMPSMWISLATSVALRLPLAYLLAYWTRSPEWPNGSPDALFISLMITWVIGAALTYLWYRRGGWMRKSIF
ncbi:MAG: MATE family efflux transporter [Oscillospiraceae bacterium]|jgi:putative MATE family efflux protein|nr:MATE family efflux transporter [Oscillospiraceae bacterium]